MLSEQEDVSSVPADFNIVSVDTSTAVPESSAQSSTSSEAEFDPSGIEVIRADINNILSKNYEDINHYMDHYGSSPGQYHINVAEDVDDMLSAVHSSAFWDNLLDVAYENHQKVEADRYADIKHEEVVSDKNKPYVDAGLEAIAECGEAMEALADTLVNPQDILESNILQSMPELALDNDTLNQHYHTTNDFIQSGAFWDDLVKMEVEAKEHVPTNLPTENLVPFAHQAEAKGSELAKELLEVIVSTGGDIARLASDTADFIEDYKTTQELEVHAIPAIDEQVAIDEEMISPINDMIPKDSFWNEVIDMHEEPMPDQTDSELENKVFEESQESVSSPISEETSVSVSTTEDKENIEENARWSPTKPKKSTTSDKTAPPRNPNDSLVTTSTVWEDLEVAAMHPQVQVLMDKGTIASDPILESLAAEIETRSLKGPNLFFSCSIMMIAFASIAMIASSTSVKESPYLFRLLWVLAFMINVFSVSMPGRLDRVLVDGNHIKPWSSLFEISTWAFAIWGVIYASEFALSGYVSIIGIPVKLFQQIVAYWLAGNWFQGLWCFSFRPEFKNALWVPTCFLALGTIAFTTAHYEITRFIKDNYPVMGFAKGGIMLFRVPFAMHAAWLAAATLINFNSFVAVSRQSKGTQIAAALLSAVAAFAFGLYGSLSTGDPILSMTAAWALEACATKTFDKMKQPNNIVNPEVHESLAITESIFSNVLKCISLGIIVAPFVAQT